MTSIARQWQTKSPIPLVAVQAKSLNKAATKGEYAKAALQSFFKLIHVYVTAIFRALGNGCKMTLQDKKMVKSLGESLKICFKGICNPEKAYQRASVLQLYDAFRAVKQEIQKPECNQVELEKHLKALENVHDAVSLSTESYGAFKTMFEEEVVKDKAQVEKLKLWANAAHHMNLLAAKPGQQSVELLAQQDILTIETETGLEFTSKEDAKTEHLLFPPGCQHAEYINVDSKKTLSNPSETPEKAPRNIDAKVENFTKWPFLKTQYCDPSGKFLNDSAKESFWKCANLFNDPQNANWNDWLLIFFKAYQLKDVATLEICTDILEQNAHKLNEMPQQQASALLGHYFTIPFEKLPQPEKLITTVVNSEALILDHTPLLTKLAEAGELSADFLPTLIEKSKLPDIGIPPEIITVILKTLIPAGNKPFSESQLKVLQAFSNEHFAQLIDLLENAGPQEKIMCGRGLLQLREQHPDLIEQNLVDQVLEQVLTLNKESSAEWFYISSHLMKPGAWETIWTKNKEACAAILHKSLKQSNFLNVLTYALEHLNDPILVDLLIKLLYSFVTTESKFTKASDDECKAFYKGVQSVDTLASKISFNLERAKHYEKAFAKAFAHVADLPERKEALLTFWVNGIYDKTKTLLKSESVLTADALTDLLFKNPTDSIALPHVNMESLHSFVKSMNTFVLKGNILTLKPSGKVTVKDIIDPFCLILDEQIKAAHADANPDLLDQLIAHMILGEYMQKEASQKLFEPLTILRFLFDPQQKGYAPSKHRLESFVKEYPEKIENLVAYVNSLYSCEVLTTNRKFDLLLTIEGAAKLNELDPIPEELPKLEVVEKETNPADEPVPNPMTVEYAYDHLGAEKLKQIWDIIEKHQKGLPNETWKQLIEALKPYELPELKVFAFINKMRHEYGTNKD